ncbi:hypothetical protein [Eikenella sp. Marseille-P7795]|uniref:hypothetical protein n=1 Tax=Eikenella sp. Marseille-P7795 TaxID=2866577 RepID=UPI001CE402AA|nr:hypothetical protein [Eikenella sp. Marseille-P7795]
MRIDSDVGLMAEPGVRRAGGQTVYLNGWLRSLLPALLAWAIVGLLGLLVCALAGSVLGDRAAKWAGLSAVLLGLKCSEGWWFGLTCRRFAMVDGRQLVVYGALGRVRFRCGLNWQFEYDGGLCAVSPDGRSRWFSLICCANRYALLDRLGAEVCDGQVREDWQQWWREFAQSQPLRHKKLLVAIYAETAAFLLTTWPILSGEWLSIRLLPTVWCAAAALTALWLLPMAWWGRGVLAGNRRFRLPEHHVWRRSAAGRVAAAVLFAGKLALFWLVMGAIFACPVAWVGGWLSLQWQPYQAVSAVELADTGDTCLSGRYGPRVPSIVVRLPEEYAAFDGAWCSRLRDDVYLLEDGSTVYLRGNVFARELLFRRP